MTEGSGIMSRCSSAKNYTDLSTDITHGPHYILDIKIDVINAIGQPTDICSKNLQICHGNSVK